MKDPPSPRAFLTSLFGLLALLGFSCTGARDNQEQTLSQTQSALETCFTAQEPTSSLPDSYVASAAPTSNFGASSYLETGAGRASYLAYDFSLAPLEASPTRATLSLTHLVGSADALQVQALNTTWNESTLIFATRPTASGEILTAPFGGGLSTVTVDVTPLLASLPQGLLLRTSTPARFASGESTTASDRPSLTLCYELATCSDGLQNGDETGIDCGGASCPTCCVPSPEDCTLPGDEDCNGDAPACVGSTLWVGHWGGTLDDRTEGVALDAALNMYAVGWYQGTVDFGGVTLTSAGARDGYIMKRSPDGALEWVRGFGGTGLDVAWAVGVNAAGDVAVAGTFQGTVDFGGGPRVGASTSTYDAVVARYDSQGNHVFSQTWGSALDDYAFGVAFANDGDVVAVGTFFNSVTVGSTTLTSHGNRDVFLVKLDPTGQAVWAKSIGGAGIDYAYGVASSQDGLLAVAGSATGTVDFGAGPNDGAGSVDAYVMVLDNTGQLVWVNRSGDSAAQDAFAAAFAPNGDVVAAGDFAGSIQFGQTFSTSTSQYDAWVARFTPTGEPLWAKQLGSPGNQDAARGVAVDGAGHVVVAGLFSGTLQLAGATLVSAGSSDIFVLKFDAAGDLLWSHRYGDATTQYAYFAAADDRAQVYIAGMFQGVTDFGRGPVTSLGSNDGFLLKLGEVSPTCTDGVQNQGETGVDCGGPCAACPSPCTGGCGGHVFSAKYGDDAHIQGGEAVAADAQGDLYFTGSFTGTLDLGAGLTLSSLTPTIYDAYLIKTTALGAPLWAKSFGNGAAPQFAYGVTVDPAGSVVVTGIARGLVDFGTGPRQTRNQDVFVAKFSSSGTPIYGKIFGDTSPQQMGLVVVADAASNVYLGCQIQGSVNFGGTTLTSAGDLDVAVVKLDASGNHIWSRMFGGTGRDEVNQIALDPTHERLIVGGTHAGTFDVGLGPVSAPAAVTQGYFVIFDENGNPLQSRGLPSGVNLDRTSSVEGAMFDSAGNIVLLGPFEEQLDLGAGPLVATPFPTASFVAKLDPAGDLIFARARPTYLVRLAVSPEDDLLFAAFDSGSGSPNDPGGGSLPAGAAVGKYDSQGEFVWALSLGAGNPNGLAVDAYGHMLLTGDITSVVDLGGGPLYLSPPSLQSAYVGSLLY